MSTFDNLTFIMKSSNPTLIYLILAGLICLHVLTSNYLLVIYHVAVEEINFHHLEFCLKFDFYSYIFPEADDRIRSWNGLKLRLLFNRWFLWWPEYKHKISSKKLNLICPCIFSNLKLEFIYLRHRLLIKRLASVGLDSIFLYFFIWIEDTNNFYIGLEPTGPKALFHPWIFLFKQGIKFLLST